VLIPEPKDGQSVSSSTSTGTSQHYLSWAICIRSGSSAHGIAEAVKNTFASFGGEKKHGGCLKMFFGSPRRQKSFETAALAENRRKND
jgi:hypothetical protein